MSLSFLRLGRVRFPPPRSLHINMMPFIMGDRASIPREYHHYWSLLQRCKIPATELGKVGYLSVEEGFVDPGVCQRRPGIHTEKSPSGAFGGAWGGAWGGLSGIGVGSTEFTGVFMASTVSNSCRIWNRHIDTPGELGCCHHLEVSLGPAELLKANELVVMTDSCPHESLPLKTRRLRQWFRFVTSDVGVWYSQHSTPNRLGIKPACLIVDKNKFSTRITTFNEKPTLGY